MNIVNPGIDELREFAVETIRKAGEIALRHYGKGDPKVKFDDELVTEAELQLMEFFRSELKVRYPDHGIFGDVAPAEEYVHGGKANLWIYDPLDGVANYQAGIPIWGISLALLENFWPVLGVFYMPVTGDLFYAQPGQQAYWGNEKISIPSTGSIDNESVLLTFSRFHDRYRSTFPGKVRNLGSTGAHICYVARGRAEGALLAHVTYQDLAAAQIILNAAGGKICKLDGSELHLSEYLGGQKITEHLLAAPEGAHASIKVYLEETN